MTAPREVTADETVARSCQPTVPSFDLGGLQVVGQCKLWSTEGLVTLCLLPPQPIGMTVAFAFTPSWLFGIPVSRMIELEDAQLITLAIR